MLRKEGATSATRLLFINAAELTQDRYFENTLASKLKSKGLLLLRIDFAFVYTENEMLWIHSELRKIKFHHGASHQVRHAESFLVSHHLVVLQIIRNGLISRYES